MEDLSGKISDFIRSDKFPPGTQLKYQREKELPSPDAVRAAHGEYLGHGADRRRNGGAE